MRAYTGVLSLTFFALLTGCSETPTDSTSETHVQSASPRATAFAEGIAVPAIVELTGDIQEVRLQQPREPALEMTEADLVSAVRDAGGRVYVGFKPLTASRTSVTGVFPVMTRDFALNARSDVLARGARLIRTFPRSATIVLEMEPSLAPVLRQLPFGKLCGTGSPAQGGGTIEVPQLRSY